MTTPPTVPFEFRGAAKRLILDKSPEVLLHGPAGTGKSMASLMKMAICAEKYGGMRGLFLRKFRATITDTALVTWEDKVLAKGHPALSGPKRTQRHIYY